jgi:hypothetical protein
MSEPSSQQSARIWSAAVALAVIAIVLAVLTMGGLATAVLVMAGVALVGAIFLLYSSIMNLTGEAEMTLDEALTLVAPSREEERKRSVLRALKDLEYERSVGKISNDDYVELVARYREEARRLLRAVEEAQADQLAAAEALADEYLDQARRAQLAAAARDKEGDDDEPQDDALDDDEPQDDALDDDEPQDDAKRKP